MPFLIIGIVVVIIIGGALYSSHLAKLRREAFAQIAQQTGMNFSADRDYSLDERYPFLNKLHQGSNRYGYNILYGDYRGSPAMVFDYHYETHSRDSKGRRKTSHHYFSFFILHIQIQCPEVMISREGFFSKIVQFFGYDDIDFESAEFSRKFCVRSPDKKFAYDFCNARMIEYLLANDDLSIEVEGNCISLFFGSCLRPEQIIPNLDRLAQIRELMPNYLFDHARQ